MKAELKPCPFCGELPEEETTVNAYNHKMYLWACNNPKCLINPCTAYYEHKGSHTKAWNRRINDG